MMTWIHYLLIYWLVCDIIGVCVRAYNKKEDSEKTTFRQVLALIFVPPFLIPLLPFVGIVVLLEKLKEFRQCRKEEREKNRLKERLGLRPDEQYCCFSRMGGAGIIKCADCGYQEEIISFVHGLNSCKIGRQCPNCHAFLVEYNKSEKYHTFGEAEEDLVCSKCGTIVRKKEESMFKGKDAPLFCPQCHSARLHYHMSYIT